MKLGSDIKASVEQLESFRNNKVWKEIKEGFSIRLEIIKENIITEPKIDKIRLLQGRAEELKYNLGLVDLMIESKKEERNE